MITTLFCSRLGSGVCGALLGLAVLVGAGAGCSGSTAEQKGRGGSGKLPPQVLDTSDVLETYPALPGAGARCQNKVCSCREIDAAGRGTSAEGDIETAPIPEGHKRFELRTGRGDDTMRITIEGLGGFVKSGPMPEAGCVYVDLQPGVYRVRYHVTAANPAQGAEPRLRISEYSPKFKRWYRTFAFRCTDGEQPCTKDLAADVFAILVKQTDGKFDPCGSTRVQGLRFNTDREADSSVGDFNLQFVLNIYKFPTRFAPDTKNCHGAAVNAKPEAQEVEGDISVTAAPK